MVRITRERNHPMSQTTTLTILERSLLLIAELAGPLVLSALVVGVIVSMIQAVTQVNEMTLSYVPKIIAIAFVLVLAFAYVFSWISAFVGLSVRNVETAQSVGFIWVFPLVFASSAFVPTAHMPGVVRTFADVNPVTQVVNAARALTIGHGHALAPTLGALAWLAGLLALFVPLSVRAFRRA